MDEIFKMKIILKQTIFLLWLTLNITCFAGKNEFNLDTIIAVVNDSVITQSELNQSLSMAKKQMQHAHIPIPPSEALRKQVLDQLINKKLQFQLVKQLGIKVTNSEIDKTIASIAKDNKMPVRELYRHVSEQGMTIHEYRKELEEQLTLQKVQQHAIGNKLSITPDEVTTFMQSKKWQAFNSKEYHLEDILIALPEKPTEKDMTEAKQRAESLIAKIRLNKLNFHQAAEEESKENHDLQGGDLGWRKLSEVPSAFTDHLVNMQQNDIAGPIQTPNGFHIVHLAGERKISKLHAKDERKQVEQLLFQRKAEEAVQTWLTKLRAEAFVKIET